MSESASVDQFLRELTEQGSRQETLSFSLDQARALHKLGESQLPDPALWIVKLVQAAVVSRASEIDIRLGRKKVELSFDHQLDFTALEAYELAVSGQLPKDAFWLHLVTGVRTLFHQSGVSLALQTVGDRGRDLVAMSDGESFHSSDLDDVSEVKRFSLVLCRPYRMLALKKALHLPVSQLARGTAAEHLELLTRCWCSPVPIRVDGRLIDTRYDSPLMHNGLQTSGQRRASSGNRAYLPQVCTGLRYLQPKPGRPSLPKDAGPTTERKTIAVKGHKLLIQKPVFRDERFLELDFPGTETGGALVSLLGRYRTSWIFCILDGVVVQRVPILFCSNKKKILGKEVEFDLGGGDSILYPVGQDDLDLSQFSVKDIEARRSEILEALVPILFESADLFMEVFSDFIYIPETRKKTKLALGVGALAALPVGLSFGGIGVGCYLGAQLFYNAGLGLAPTYLFRKIVEIGFQRSLELRKDFNLADIEQPPINQ